ncbi:hypothetical protein SLOPH_2548 [Spraguea lophii 42_110]|uniref:Uncharacterized protein n=1 Tax=Spraguea lophii (strain 42_110) TaxID=1358809 RepID=S7XF72_SPRLO|nr:hypothetical protein SLOPH_2548 [Spraguea lophii 42_110]
MKSLTPIDASTEESHSILNIPDENDSRKINSQVASQIQNNSPILEENQPIHNKKTTSEMESTLKQNTLHYFPFARNYTRRINRKKLEEEVKDIDLTYEHHPEENPRIVQYNGPCVMRTDIQPQEEHILNNRTLNEHHPEEKPHIVQYNGPYVMRVDIQPQEEHILNNRTLNKHHSKGNPCIVHYNGPYILENDVQIPRPGLAYY